MNKIKKSEYVNDFIEEHQDFFEKLAIANTLAEARELALKYVIKYEDMTLNSMYIEHPIERGIARRCIHALKNMFSLRSEQLTEYSVVNRMWKIAKNDLEEINDTNIAFTMELTHLLRGVKGNTSLYENIATVPKTIGKLPVEISKIRSDKLDKLARHAQEKANSYAHGLQEDIISRREQRKQKILKELNATEEEWQSWEWQCRNVIRDLDMAEKLIELSDEEKQALRIAKQKKLPFGITPYYAMLFDDSICRTDDHAIRAQVLPPLHYAEAMQHVSSGKVTDFDFMGEQDTSPEDLITRRYPMISIFKPYNTCAQICVYCQRNWEIDDVLDKNAQASDERMDKAIKWYNEHPEVTEILITGGDPAVMSISKFRKVLERVSGMKHIKRIRIGTRTPVVMPMRITERFAEVLASYIIPGEREVCIMTHFEHGYEVTPEAMLAVQRLRKQGISVYNQGVFTIENARRFEMVALRKLLRLIGVDPYYTFNTKGKEETKNYRVPIARLIQEQAEEARLNPGLERTDEAVYNIPRLGKNYLRAGQDHELVMVMKDGTRVYEFYPWDTTSIDLKPYIHYDLALYDFLYELNERGEDLSEYESIWYYL